MNGFFWLASYPKSGNTWLRLFLASLEEGGALPGFDTLNLSANAASRSAFDWWLDLDSTDLTEEETLRMRPRLYELEARAAETPMLRKAHDAWVSTSAGEPLLPLAVTLGAVYIVRDPRDVAVSFAHHMRQSIDQAITRMANPKAVMEMAKVRAPVQLPQPLLDWSGHVESWLNAPVRRLLLRYEDMQAEPVACFGEAARFLGFDASQERITTAVEAVRFERLRAAEEITRFAETPAMVDRFFRRGIAGGWRDTLTPEQAAPIEADHGSVMRKLGYL
jgi:aryl sulfotransferase